MAEPITPNVGLIVPNTGDLVGTWGSAALNPDFIAIDGMLGGTATISLAAAATTILTIPTTGTLAPGSGPNQSQNACIFLQGTLTGNNIIQLKMPGRYVFHNKCLPWTFSVQVAPASGSGTKVGLAPGKKTTVFFDGTNVDFVDQPDTGTAYDLHGVTALPVWMTACSVLPYLIKDGTVYTISQYPYLGGLLGNKFGGDGVSTFGVPDERERARIAINPAGQNLLTTAVSGINGGLMGSAGGNQNPQQHTHTTNVTVTDPGHMHTTAQALTTSGGPFFFASGSGATQTTTSTDPTGVTVGVTNNNTFTGAAGNVQPSIISFLPLIKTVLLLGVLAATALNMFPSNASADQINGAVAATEFTSQVSPSDPFGVKTTNFLNFCFR